MRDPRKRLATVNLLIGMFRQQLGQHEAETPCKHEGTVAMLRAGLAKQEGVAADLEREIASGDAAVDVASPFDVTAGGMTLACREGQCHACAGDPWRVTADDPIGCSCPHHRAPKPIRNDRPEEDR